MTRQLHCIVKGFVQGVFFRPPTLHEARRMGVTGWVGDLPNGTAEVMAEGDDETLKEFLPWVQKGPSLGPRRSDGHPMAKLHRRVHGLSPPGLTLVSGALISLACALHAPLARAQTPDAGRASAAAANATGDESVGRSVAEIDALLGRLTDGSPTDRRAAADAILEALERDDVPAIRQRLLAPIRFDIDPLRFKMVRAVQLVTAARPNAEYDLLTLLINLPRSRDVDVAIERITLARALGRIPTADAGRGLLALAAAYNGAFRMEVGRIVRNQLKDYILPAIIEMRNPSEGMRIFIRQTREAMRRVTPGETVQQRDNALLAEILRAYGSVRQPDAMKVVISFVNSDRAQVREAARWSVSQYGPSAVVALREAYEMYEGRDPNPAWGWERTAQELYQANDRRRDAEVAQRLDQGLAAGRGGNVDEMLGHFRFVLARHPLFERRREMIPVLIENARRLEESDASKAETLWRLALWVEPDGARSREARGAILFLEAERALARGVADPELYRAVLRVDPNNERAKDQLDNVEQADALNARRRWRGFGALALLGLAGGTLYALTRRSRRSQSQRPKSPPPPATTSGDGVDATTTQPDAPAKDDTHTASERAMALETAPG